MRLFFWPTDIRYHREGDLTLKNQLDPAGRAQDALKDAATGAALGGTLGKGAEHIPDLASKLLQYTPDHPMVQKVLAKMGYSTGGMNEASFLPLITKRKSPLDHNQLDQFAQVVQKEFGFSDNEMAYLFGENVPIPANSPAQSFWTWSRDIKTKKRLSPMESAFYHAKKHLKEFLDVYNMPSNPRETDYVKLAQEPVPSGSRKKVNDRKTVYFYDEAENALFIRLPDELTPRSLFKPEESLHYFDDIKGVEFDPENRTY